MVVPHRRSGLPSGVVEGIVHTPDRCRDWGYVDLYPVMGGSACHGLWRHVLGQEGIGKDEVERKRSKTVVGHVRHGDDGGGSELGDPGLGGQLSVG